MRAAGTLALTRSAFSPAKLPAIAGASAPAPTSAHLLAVSSTAAGTTSKTRPSAVSNRRRCWLAEANTRRCAGAHSFIGHSRLGLRPLLAIVQKAYDRGSRLLHRAPGHVDDGPAMARTQPLGMCDLVGNLSPVYIVVEVTVSQKMHTIAPNFGDALGAGDQPHDEGGVRFGQRGGELDVRHQRQVGGLIASLGQVDTGRGLRGSRD